MSDTNDNRRKTVLNIIRKLRFMQDELRDMVQDDMCEAEERVAAGIGYYDDFTEDDNGNPVGIVYPENASPYLDTAVGALEDLIDLLFFEVGQRTFDLSDANQGESI